MDPELFYKKTESLIRRYKPDIKPSSLATYINNLRVLSTQLFKRKTFLPRYFYDVDSVKTFLEESRPLVTTRGNFLSSIIVYLKSLPSFPLEKLKLYTDWQSDLLRQHSESQSLQERSTRETENWLTPDDLAQKKNEIRQILTQTAPGTIQNLDFYQRLLVLSLYTDLPPIRNDYANVKVVEAPGGIDTTKLNCDYNYIDLQSSQLILCNYKTNKTYGTKSITIPKGTSDLIRTWLTSIRKIPIPRTMCAVEPAWLLVNIKDESKMTTNGLTKFINKIFSPKKVSTTLLRKIYLSHKYPVIHTTAEQENDAFCMGHSVSTQQTTYRKKTSS